MAGTKKVIRICVEPLHGQLELWFRDEKDLCWVRESAGLNFFIDPHKVYLPCGRIGGIKFIEIFHLSPEEMGREVIDMFVANPDGTTEDILCDEDFY